MQACATSGRVAGARPAVAPRSTIARPASARLCRAVPQVPRLPTRTSSRTRAAAAADASYPEPESSSVAVADPPKAVEPYEMDVTDIKAALLDSLFGTERGLNARSEIRAEINELISQLEAKNPTPSPAETLDSLTGNWKLVYTSNSELLAVLALSRLPFVTIGDITQKIDGAANTVENRVQISVPLSRTSFSTTASFEVRSPKRLQLKVEKGSIQTPELLSSIDLPSSITVLGQSIDLTQVKTVLDPVNESLKGILDQVGGFISQQPDLQIPINGERQPQTWLLTTYLDDDTRITRGDGGSVFILVKEVSITTTTTAEAETAAELLVDE